MHLRIQIISALDDESLLTYTRDCARTEREHSALLVAHLAEVERRDLALKRGYSSMFQYARQELMLSESMAWERISAAKLAVQMPETIEKLSKGELTLASAGELWKTLREAEKVRSERARIERSQATELQPALEFSVTTNEAAPSPPSLEEKRELLGQVLGKTRRESQAVLQTWKQERAREPKVAGPVSRTPLGISLTDEQLAQWDRLRDLVSHKLGTTDPQKVFEWLLNVGLEKVDPVRKEARIQKQKKPTPAAVFLARPETPRQENPRQKNQRALPSALKRKVFLRDQGRCQFTDPATGRKCGATAFLDYDHRTPISEGGRDIESNLELACASHNRRRLRWGS